MTEILAVVIGAILGFAFSLILVAAERNTSLRRDVALECATWVGLARSCLHLRDDVEADATIVKLQTACDRICILGRSLIDTQDITTRTYEILALLLEWKLHLARDVMATNQFKTGQWQKEKYMQYCDEPKRVDSMNRLYNAARLSADHVAALGSTIGEGDWLSRILDPSA